jgi:hypothetical protein
MLAFDSNWKLKNDSNHHWSETPMTRLAQLQGPQPCWAGAAWRPKAPRGLATCAGQERKRRGVVLATQRRQHDTGDMATAVQRW